MLDPPTTSLSHSILIIILGVIILFFLQGKG
jgi:hypothetical protein